MSDSFFMNSLHNHGLFTVTANVLYTREQNIRPVSYTHLIPSYIFKQLFFTF